MDRNVIHDELERTRQDYHHLLERAHEAELDLPSNGTRWTNRQLLFHMLLGFLVVRALLILVRLFSRLPAGVGRAFARLLNAGTRPFDTVNYLGSYLGGRMLGRDRLIAMFDQVIARLHHRLDAETDLDLARGMHYPTRWDPFFEDYMTLADIYLYPTRHFDFHRRQLTLADRTG
ncbi:MAG TPA: DinB family protein [Kribbella sp.]|nr:DinB family protein [Kribbella sp.]